MLLDELQANIPGILELQRPDGSWRLTAELAQLVGIGEDSLRRDYKRLKMSNPVGWAADSPQSKLEDEDPAWQAATASVVAAAALLWCHHGGLQVPLRRGVHLLQREEQWAQKLEHWAYSAFEGGRLADAYWWHMAHTWLAHHGGSMKQHSCESDSNCAARMLFRQAVCDVCKLWQPKATGQAVPIGFRPEDWQAWQQEEAQAEVRRAQRNTPQRKPGRGVETATVGAASIRPPVNWAAMVGATHLPGGLGSMGVILCEVERGKAVVVKSGDTNLAGEYFGTLLARHLGLLCPDARIVRTSSPEGQAILDNIAPCLGQDELPRLHRMTKRPYLIVMEWMAATHSFNHTTALNEAQARDLGSILVLDILLNNHDRLPLLWDNPGNPFNVLVRPNQRLVAIDQAANHLDPQLAAPVIATILQRLDSQLATVRSGDTTRSLHPAQIVRDFLLKETGLDLGGSPQALEWCHEGFCATAAECSKLEGIQRLFTQVEEQFAGPIDVGLKHLRWDWIEAVAPRLVAASKGA